METLLLYCLHRVITTMLEFKKNLFRSSGKNPLAPIRCWKYNLKAKPPISKYFMITVEFNIWNIKKSILTDTGKEGKKNNEI